LAPVAGSLDHMVDIDAAIGYVVARGDAVDRARLSYLRTGATPSDEIVRHVEAGQTGTGGWPAQGGGDVASVDATCFRLVELDGLGGLGRPAASRALDWLVTRQRLDGCWEEDMTLADAAPPWARPGDPEARFYLTASAAYWLGVASAEKHEIPLTRAAQTLRDAVDDGAWPGFLVSGWLAAAVLQMTEYFYEAARIFVVLGQRVTSMSAADTASMGVALRRVGVPADDALLVAVRQRLSATQRPDGGWPSGDSPAFDVHVTLDALRATR
jgi:hypothetical protein